MSNPLEFITTTNYMISQVYTHLFIIEKSMANHKEDSEVQGVGWYNSISECT